MAVWDYWFDSRQAAEERVHPTPQQMWASCAALVNQCCLDITSMLQNEGSQARSCNAYFLVASSDESIPDSYQRHNATASPAIGEYWTYKLSGSVRQMDAQVRSFSSTVELLKCPFSLP